MRSLSGPSIWYSLGCFWISWITAIGSMFGLLSNTMRPPFSPSSSLRMPSSLACSLSSAMANRCFTGSGSRPKRSIISTCSSRSAMLSRALEMRLYNVSRVCTSGR
ncbi:hypothetical protein D3C81_1879980 [compost metagenome]